MKLSVSTQSGITINNHTLNRCSVNLYKQSRIVLFVGAELIFELKELFK